MIDQFADNNAISGYNLTVGPIGYRFIMNRESPQPEQAEMMEQKDNSEGSMGSPSDRRPISLITWKTSVKALLYKSVKIQQRNICANICQIITPLLCVLFTIMVKVISEQLVVPKIPNLEFPKPFSIPILYDLLPFNLTCEQFYFFEYDGPAEYSQAQIAMMQELLDHNLKHYCGKTQSLQPRFTHTPDMNKNILALLKEADKQDFAMREDINSSLPDGLFKLHQIDLKGDKKKINVTIGINDYRLSEYHRNNGVTKIAFGDSLFSYVMTTEGMMGLIEKITRPFLQQINPKEIIFGSYMYMPFDGQDTSMLDKTVNVVGSGLYPLGLSLLLPLFLYAIVSEKEEKLIEIMRMNGLNIKYYWVSTFIFNFCLSLITFFIFFAFGRYVLALTFFTQTDAGLMWLTLVGWAIAQISMTNFVQIFISNGKSATIIGYLLSIFSTLVGEVIAVFIYAYPLQVPTLMLFYPPFSLCRIIYLMGLACSTTGCYSSVFNSDHQILFCIGILYLWGLMFLLSIWLDGQVQQQYGVAHRSSIFKCLDRFFQKKKLIDLNEQTGGSDMELNQLSAQAESGEKSPGLGKKVDYSVQKTRDEINGFSKYEKQLITKDLMKKYATNNGKVDYVALKPLSFYIQNKEIFGLLGPNGAGKTTLISVLTGMYPKTSGNAWISGVEVGTGEVNEYIGVCPQFDLLWPSLSVFEHLKFYATLKGINESIMTESIEESLRDVDLLEWKDTPSCELSGGMQRRLSIAIALVANPSVVFLDEPSSGLDPSHRRKMWDILLRCKNKTSIILTTHLMEEAEALCDRIGIISKGDLKCIGTTQELKDSFGEGYRLHINFTDLLSPSNEQIIKQLSEGKFGATVISRLDRRAIFKVNKQQVLECVGALKRYKSINWMVSQPSLYDVFMNFVE